MKKYITQFLFIFLCIGHLDAKALHEDSKADKFFKEYSEVMARNYSYYAYGSYQEKFKDKFNDFSSKNLKRVYKQEKRIRSRFLLEIDRAKLSKNYQLYYDLFIDRLEDRLSFHKWNDYHFIVSPHWGIHQSVIYELQVFHQIKNEKDARDYIRKVIDSKRYLAVAKVKMQRQLKKGIVQSKSIILKTLEVLNDSLKGRPFNDVGFDHAILKDFKRKIAHFDHNKQKKLSARLKKVLLGFFSPGLQSIINLYKQAFHLAGNRDGVWSYPRGKDFYDWTLKHHTTTNLSATEIHELGLQEVNRLHQEISLLMPYFDFKGSVPEFLKHMSLHDDFYFENSKNGRQAYLKQTKESIQRIENQMSVLFEKLPQVKFEVLEVPKHLENSSRIAYYVSPSDDQSKPGQYFINLKNMKNLPIYEIEATAFHELIPGHHIQALYKILNKKKVLPRFMKYNNFTAHLEGWGLYSEFLAKEYGGYSTKLSEYGRLTMELLRASRLVVDTGLHAMKWNKKRAIEYLQRNSSMKKDAVISQINRYISFPGQATAYMIGRNKILELRRIAKKNLKDKFDIKEFHAVILGNGVVSLNVLESLVMKYIKGKKDFFI